MCISCSNESLCTRFTLVAVKALAAFAGGDKDALPSLVGKIADFPREEFNSQRKPWAETCRNQVTKEPHHPQNLLVLII